jgi:hypothetical protein
METNQSGSIAWGPWNDNLQQRSTNHLQVRARGYITVDAREQTAYGTARGYLAVGTSNNDIGSAGTNTFSSNRAFVQWAGITAGLSQSFYDFYSSAAAAYRGFIVSEDTGDGGWWVWAYTAQLGNGFSATLSAEDRRQMQILDFSPGLAGGGAVSVTAANGAGYGGWQAPDVVGNIRVDQTWGSAQIMAAAHEVNPLYYGSTVASLAVPGVNAGHPGDTWGWVVGAGLKYNTPFITQGDYFQGEVNYTQGAIRYLMHGVSNNVVSILAGNQQTFGVASDCVFGGTIAAANTTGCQLTTGWSVNASFEHYWTPQWHESVFGGYANVRYNQEANAMLCTGVGGGATFGSGTGATAVAAPGCNNNWNLWGIGTRLQWDVTKTFYLGVEGIYDHLNGASTPGAVIPTALAITTSQTNVNKSSQNNWSGTVRIHKDFLP